MVLVKSAIHQHALVAKVDVVTDLKKPREHIVKVRHRTIRHFCSNLGSQAPKRKGFELIGRLKQRVCSELFFQ
jgi:hypothetical protein